MQDNFHIDRRAAKLLGDGQARNDDALLSVREVAEWLGVSVKWLERCRAAKTGIPFIRVGRCAVRYRKKDVVAWLDSRRVAFERRNAA
jgi:excisionase family DNA binding protein